LALNKLSLQPEGYAVYGADSCVGFIDSYAQSEDYISIVKDGSGVGRLSLNRGKSSVLGTMAYIKSKPNSETTLSWLFYCLTSLDFRNFIKGSGIPHIYFSDFASHKILVPPSPEQQKIAGCLTSLDELIAVQTRKVGALKTHKNGLMQQLFPSEGETQPRFRFPEFQNAGEWEVQRLDELAQYENGKAHENDIADTGRYIVVNSKFIATEGAVRKFSNVGFCVAGAGDILMVLSDVPNGRAIAKCYFVESDDLYTVNQRICRIQPTRAIGRFLFYVLNRNPYFLDFDDGIKQTNLRKEDVVGCPLRVPPIQGEQQCIADCLTALDDVISAQTQKLNALKRHKQGLMQQLFPFPAEVEA
jgi:type I restriction enzyme S subunit